MFGAYYLDNIFKRARAHFLRTHLNGFKYCNLIQIIHFTINHLFGHS